ncbi:MAG: helix-hairpin-helix domain-containing protein [Bacilli bacterium]|nr:helix-hairpin-helix domain-containing protein [Bacilli bacterium]
MKIKLIIEKYKKIIIIISIVLLIVISIIVNNIPKKKVKEKEIREKEVIKNSFNVHVKGEVKSPKSFSFDDEIYLYEIILLCGGFTDYSDIDNINLIEKISKDKEIIIDTNNIKNDNNIYIYDISKDNNKVLLYFGRIEDKISIYVASKNSSLYEILWLIDIDNSNYIDEIILSDKCFIKIDNGLININVAGVEELMSLDNIGRATALKIIEYRETNGPFLKIEDIMNVSGIKEATFLLIKDKICV